jgi:DMSO reductase anchor subunit
MNGHTTIAEDLAGRMRLRLRDGLAMVLSWPVKIACALVALYTLFYVSGQRFFMEAPLLVPDTVPAFAGYLIWAFVIGHVAFAYLYGARIRTARNYTSYTWLKEPGGIGSMLKVAIKPGLLGLVVYGLARLLQARDLPLIGPMIAQSEAARVLDQHLLARFLPEVHGLFLQGGIVGDVVPYVSRYPELVESGILLVVLGILAFYVGRWRDDLARTMRRVYGN